MKPILSDQHPYIRSSIELKAFCWPLKNFNITCFTYLKNYHSGKQINISSDPKWIADYYSLSLFESSHFESNPKAYQTSYALWSSLTSNTNVILHGRDYFNSDFGITIIQKVLDGCEFFFFSGPKQKSQMHNFFINNFEIIHHFILFFKDKFTANIKNLEKNKLVISRQQLLSSEKFHEWFGLISKEKKDNFLLNSKIKQLHHENQWHKPIRFSPQQTDCIRLILEYYQVPDIAKKLKLSERTIESYIGEIKNKLSCHTKVELYKKLMRYKTFL